MIEPTPPRPGEPLRASWAQRLVSYVRSLRVSAGPGLVARRTPSGTVVSLAETARARSVFVQGMQWRITAKKGEGESFVVSVGPGIVAWGAGVNFSHPGEENLGALSAGESARIVWVTSAAPVPLVRDPRWPTGNGPSCPAEGCDCPSKTGDPAGRGGDAGELLLVDDGWTAPDGTTDVREIGSVEISDAGAVAISQLQRDTIVARAIVGRNPGGEDPEEAYPPCGNPLNDENDYNPLDDTGGSYSGGGGGAGDNPLDNPGDGGYTPTCRDNIVNAA